MTARKVFKRLGGFTLVELLIVIALLAIIALIVIAAINPIEQANRARDTGMKSDASQLLSAVDRYFASKEEFPWVTVDNNAGGTMTNDEAFGFMTADAIEVGLCLIDPCKGVANNQGLLISGQELKPEFLNRRFIDAANISDNLFIGKADQDQSVYICYIPAAQSNRQKSCEDDTIFQLDATGGRTPYNCDPAAPPTWVPADGLMTSAYTVCIPQ
jgi:prepilin-type N-terminal cleavage/methylation domain-containing protein